MTARRNKRSSSRMAIKEVKDHWRHKGERGNRREVKITSGKVVMDKTGDKI